MGSLKRPKAALPGAALCSAILVLDERQRYKLGRESLCQLVVELYPQTHLKTIEAEFHRRLWRISYTAWGQQAPAAVERLEAVSASMVVWACLGRLCEFADALKTWEPLAPWRQLHDTIDAWRDAWGNDAKADDAFARFAALTQTKPGRQPKKEYLDKTLLAALAAVQC